MCGRFTLLTPGQRIAELFDTEPFADVTPRYNIAPTQQILAIRNADESGKRECAYMRWGLIPSWTRDAEGQKTLLLNARAETVASKPSFRSSFKAKRCLIPADGFFEWKPEHGRKQPYYITRPDKEPFAFAGLWDRWIDPDGKPIDSCTIITTEANELMRTLHERMPVILQPGDYANWLDRTAKPSELETLLKPFPPDALKLTPVNPIVNNARVDQPQCVEPVGEQILWQE